MEFRFRCKNNSGIILIVTIWILIILTILAVGIGHRNSIGIKLSRYSIDKLKSYYIAKAGVWAVTRELVKDLTSSQTKDYDTLYSCGISLADNQTPEDIFKDRTLGEGYYSVGYEIKTEGQTRLLYGLLDEERKINLNAINPFNQLVLEKLLELLDIDSQIAKTIASSVADWRDDDSELANPDYGAEDNYYLGLEKPYYCKNSMFESLNELSMIRGMTEDIFLKLKDYVTIYPMGDVMLKVNINTADKLVLTALAQAAAEIDGSPQTNKEDADRLAEKIVDYRAGDDNIKATRQIDLQNPGGLDLFGPEESLFIYLKDAFLVSKSEFFRAKIRGIYGDKRIASEIETVLTVLQTPPIIYWHEQ